MEMAVGGWRQMCPMVVPEQQSYAGWCDGGPGRRRAIGDAGACVRELRKTGGMI